MDDATKKQAPAITIDNDQIKTASYEEPTSTDHLSPEDQIKEALRAVSDPEIGLNVVQLGLIREINLNSDPGEIKMLMTTPFCPYAGWLVQQVKDAAQQVAGRTINVTVLPDLWDPNYMEDPGLLTGW